MYTAYVYYVFVNHTGFYENNYSIEDGNKYFCSASIRYQMISIGLVDE
jgi:hypothetical protein